MLSKKTILISLVIIIVLVIAACQATPEKEIVVSKNDGKLEEKIVEPVVTEQNVTEDKQWNENFTINNIEINIDTLVEIPDTLEYPVVRVRPTAFDSKTIESAISELSQNEILYRHDNDKNSLLTKEVIQSLIIEQKQKIQEIGDEENDEFVKQNYESIVQDLEKKYESAPSEIEIIREKVDLENINPNNCSIYFDSGKNIPATISVSDERESLNRMIFRYYNYGFDGAYTDTHHQDEQPNGVLLSREDAVQLCKETLEKMGIDYMDVSDVSVSNEYSNFGYFGDDTKQCYTIYFSRTYENIPTPLVQLYAWKQMGYESGTSEEYKNPWTPEYIMIDVDDTGILAIHWQNPVEIVEVENKNVAVLDFDAVKEKFQSDMELVLSNGAYSQVESEVNITKIVLGNQFVPIQDNMDEYRLMPCWIFFGNDSWLGEMSEEVPTSEVLLNAIDGSIL